MTKNSVHAVLPKGLSLFLCLSLACPASLWANPVGGVVVGGAASITYGATAIIEQTTDRAIIDWTSFSLAGGEITQFQHALGSPFAVLNRVTGALPSVIDGSIFGSGNVFLINPNGVLIGFSGQINTDGFVASTLDLNNGDFMFGSQFNFTGASLSGVQNDGSIAAALGDVVLIGQTVSNTGTITASNGTAALAAGADVLYKPLDEERVFVQAGVANGDATGVDQAGTIQAASAELKAAGGNVYALAINNSGTINADQVGIVGGRIYLTAESGLDSGAVSNSGALRTTKGLFGGEVLISGDQVTIETDSEIVAADLQATADTRILLYGDINGEVYTDGSQTYNGPVVLGDPLTLYTTQGDITLNGTVDSMDDGGGLSNLNSLTVQTDAGSISLNGAVGGLYELGSLDVSATGGQIGLNADVTTGDHQNYYGAVDVGADAVLTALAGYVYFAGTVDSANLSALTVDAYGYTDFANAVGATALGDLTLTTAAGSLGEITFQSTLDSDGSIVLNSDTYVDFNGAVGGRALGGLSVTSAGDIWFMGTLDSGAGADISLTTPSDVVFDGAVGGTSLGGLTVDGGYVDFNGTLDSDGSAILNSAMYVDFYGDVGVRALDSLSVTTPDPGYLSVGGAVNTTGAQTYNGAVNFSPSDGVSDAAFTSGGGAIDFLGTLDTNGYHLSVDAGAGNVTFGDAVAAGNLTVAGGDVEWNGALNGADVLLTGTNLIMQGDVNSTGANGVVMVAASSFDNTAAAAITTDPSARWLVYSDDPDADVAGGLSGESERGVSYPEAPSFAGNGFLYASVPAAADQPSASELDSFEASLAPPPALVVAGGESMIVDGAAEAAPGEFGSDDGGSDGGSSGDSESGDGEKEKDGDK